MILDPHQARQVPPGRAQKLTQAAAEAAQVRVYQTHPDVIALRVERVRAQVDRLCWTGIVLGLAFTMTNVQSFAAAGALAWSLPWLAAWLLDPMVSVVLLAILRGEQITARYQVRTGPWVRRAKWFTLAATYVMNTWASYAQGDAAAIVLHSVPPLVVFAATEAVTDLRDKLTEAVHAAFTEAAHRVPAVLRGGGEVPTAEGDAGSTGGRTSSGRRCTGTCTGRRTGTAGRLRTGTRPDSELAAVLLTVPREPDGTVPVRRAAAALGCGPDRARRLLTAAGLLRTPGAVPGTAALGTTTAGMTVAVTAREVAS